MTALHAITIRQPWALCVATGHKTVENRGRATSHRGPIAIHAARAHDPAGDTDPRVTGLWGRDPRVGAPTGAVIAVADLTDCHLAGPCVNLRCHPWGEHDYNARPAWHLVLANVRRLARPVPARGEVRLPWLLPDEESAEVMAQLAEASA